MNKWHHPLTKRAKRPELTQQGVYILEHVATGRFFVAESKTVSEQVDKDIALLEKESHPCKILNGLYKHDNELFIREFEAKKGSDRNRLFVEATTSSNKYLCLNHVEKKRRSKSTIPKKE